MTNILMLIPDRGDATSFYRAIAPFHALRRKGCLQLHYAKTVDWTLLVGSDVAFLQRPHTPEHLAVAKLVKQWNVPLWIDYDDLLAELTPWNSQFIRYRDPVIQNATDQLGQLADVVTVSTDTLKGELAGRGWDPGKIEVVPNALLDSLVPRARPYSGNPTLVWRGNESQNADLQAFGSEIVNFSRAHPDYSLEFWGHNPWTISNEVIVTVRPIQPLGDYLDTLCQVNPALVIKPLLDCPFNRCKSNIAWIEATLAGAVCVGPCWDGWLQTGALTYGGPGDFGRVLEMALDPATARQMHRISWEQITGNLLLSQVNGLREKILDSLLNP